MPSDAQPVSGKPLGELLAAVCNSDESPLAAPQIDATLAVKRVQGVRLDSRQVGKGDLYLALRGATTHGIRHAQSALARGAVAVAVDASDLAALDSDAQRAFDELAQEAAPVVAIPSLASRAGELARCLFDHPDRSLTLLAVTGTDGKTSVCRFIAAALAELGTPCGYVGTLGWGLGDELEDTDLTTPDAPALVAMLAALREQGARAVALEASSHGIATGRLDGLALDVAVLTNVGRDHLDFHGSLEAYRQAKARLFGWPSLSAVIINGDDEFGLILSKSLANSRPNLHQTVFGARGALTAEAVESTMQGLNFTLIDDATEHRVESALIGRFNVDNLLACHAALTALGHSSHEAASVLHTLRPVAGRMERFVAVDRPTVVVDYAHTPQALEAAIAAARAHCRGELWVVFGCGGDRDRGKRGPMGRMSEAADHVVVTDDNPRTEQSEDIIADVLAGMREPDQVVVIADRRAAISHAVNAARHEDLVLVAGKGHEDYQIVGAQRLSLSDRDCVGDLLAEAC